MMKIVKSEELLRTPIFWVTMDQAVDPEGFVINRAIVQHGGSAVILPIDEKGRVLLARQYRLPAQDYLWEIPAGRMDEGETPLQAAKRELKEETGLSAKKWTKLFGLYMSPGFLAEKMHIYAAQDLKQGKTKFMEDERIQSQWFTPKQMNEMIQTGKIIDGKTIAAWLAWRNLFRSK
ncbi:MAG TPA: NUDIX hydrolase [Bryobacteraceae bacterium]|nr:NUDIX hydrolase [Bryobacteraceae bacterium]